MEEYGGNEDGWDAEEGSDAETEIYAVDLVESDEEDYAVDLVESDEEDLMESNEDEDDVVGKIGMRVDQYGAEGYGDKNQLGVGTGEEASGTSERLPACDMSEDERFERIPWRGGGGRGNGAGTPQSAAQSPQSQSEGGQRTPAKKNTPILQAGKNSSTPITAIFRNEES